MSPLDLRFRNRQNHQDGWRGERQLNDVPEVPVWKSTMIDLTEAYVASTAVARHARVMTTFQVLKRACFLSVRTERIVNERYSGKWIGSWRAYSHVPIGKCFASYQFWMHGDC